MKTAMITEAGERETSVSGAPEQPAAATDRAPREDVDPNEIRELVIDALRAVYDPEIPVNIYELGLIYDIDVEDDGAVKIKMTLTSPHCPVAESLPSEVGRAASSAAGVRAADVEVVWDPAWNPDMMSEAAKLELGMF